MRAIHLTAFGKCLSRRIFLSLYLVTLVTSVAFAADYQAKVIHIADGDTITVLNDQHEEIKIRLNGIDCPEKAQAYGNKATQFTKGLVHGKTVTIHAHDRDKYGRTIGDVILDDGRNLSQELVKAGYAWWYFKYSDDEHLGSLEAQAKMAKVGLWADQNPVPPWIYRHRNELATLPLSRPPPSASVAQPSESVPEISILGNRRSKKYHRPDCPSYSAISPKNRVAFSSSQEAQEAGYTLAGNCPH